MPSDAELMSLALRLARRAEGRVEPNPMVGCVLTRNGKIIGRGHHRRYGGPHAEIYALRDCAGNASGATAYVTLEPCCHFGKTGPCTEALIAARVSRVVAAIRDPNPLIAGKGLQRLRDAGIETALGEQAAAATDLAAPFLKRMKFGLPWVIAKWGQSLDGKLATRTRETRWITNEEQRHHAHTVRGRLDAIVIGTGTALADDPTLTARDVPIRRLATRVVFDSKLRLPLRSNLVHSIDTAPLLLFCDHDAPTTNERRLISRGATIIRLPEKKKSSGKRAAARHPSTASPLHPALEHLALLGMSNVLVEGGPTLLSAFISQNLVDEIHTYVAPTLIGDAAAPGPWPIGGVERLTDAPRFNASAELKRLGDGWLYRARSAASLEKLRDRSA